MEVDGILSTIRFLSSNAAAFLQTLRYEHAVLVVQEVQLMIRYWEARHVTLDPIERECVLDSIVYGLGSIVCGFDDAVSDLVEAMQRSNAAGADGDQLSVTEGNG